MRIQRLQTLPPFVFGQRSPHHFASFLMLLVLIVLGLPAFSGAQPTCLPDGDVDRNGSVTAADALLAFQQALGLVQLTACQRNVADVFPQPASPDDTITASDALCIFQKALSLPSCLDALPSSNQPPVVDAGPDQSVDAGVMVFLSGTASDPDGGIAAYAWTQTGGGMAVSLTGADAATAVFVAPEVSVEATLTFRLTVTDDSGAQASDEVRVTVQPVMQPAEPTSAAEVFHQAISTQVVQGKCVTCHVQGGASGNTRLVFVDSDTPDHEALNLRAFEDLLAAVADEGGGSYVLNKIQGVGHGGGVQVSPGSAEFANMQRFLGLLGEEVEPAPVTVETLFDTVVMASPRKTLRRAALIFAGRIPTDAEYAAVEGGDESVLRATIRGLMEGPQFHEFLIRASNDRLLTDREGRVIDAAANNAMFVDLSNLYHQKAVAVSQGRLDEGIWRSWEGRVQFGIRRAPLELIAHVAENDLPYTEILTADYIMANPMAAEAYGASTVFADPDNPFEFRPSKIVSYYRNDESKVWEYSLEFGTKVTDPGDLGTIYPHAGILNTTVFLWRYPTTATNRNRARSRWTYYHFLGVDVEKSASRTTDPAALADTNNPTMGNPACTVCHQRLDPVAGAFQNYGDNGFYRDQWGGMDSLDEFYKYPEGKTFEIEADSWVERQTFSITAWLDQDSHLVLRHRNSWCDDIEGTCRHFRLDELAVRDVESGALVHKVAWEVLDEHCFNDGQYNEGTGKDDHYEWWGWDCEAIPLDLPEAATYLVEVVAWADRAGDKLAKLAIGTTPYHEGDTWYRDMRIPGFTGKEAPNPNNSLQWLAQQIIADVRFAEAAVKFWWPAIMGSETAEPPEDAADADFEGLLLAVNAQGAEVERLANGFRDGFPGSPYIYNLKDLLVEIALSKWFRADAVTDADPVRRVVLQDTGAKRLLTPEELARKTAAVTGFQWGRYIHPDDDRWPSSLTDEYRLLYGGIDSGGVIERSRDITSVMAGVAKRHAVQVSCPIVMREVYLLSDENRRLFAGIDPHVTPVSEFSASFEIKADSRARKETLSLGGVLSAGHKTVNVGFTNDYRDANGDREVHLDRLDVRNVAGRVVASFQFEDLPSSGCDNPVDDRFVLSCTGSVEASVNVPVAGSYTIEIVVWADQAGNELPRLFVVVESDAEGSAGADAIRNKLVELHDKLLGVQVTPNSPDVEAVYRLFVDVWERKQAEDADVWFRWLPCHWGTDIFFFEGILDDVVVQHENEDGHRWHGFDWDRVNDFLDGVDFSDPHRTAQAWVVVLAAVMMDYRYLYL